MGSQPVSRAGQGILYVIIGAILIVGIAIFLRNLGALIDSVNLDIRVAGIIIAVIALIGVGFWLRGHQIYAKSKGGTAFWGFVLGLLPVLGLVVLAALPGRPASPEQAGAGPTEPELAPSEGEEQDTEA